MSAEIPPGTILLDKYRVDRVLGQGGMGVVLAATHLQLQERVAMKFLLPEVLSNHEIVTRFMREAQAAVRLKGEHVARVIDVGTLPWGAPYMVMEYLQGEDLSALIQTRGYLPPHEAVDYLLQACEALAEAHSLGIIHRDIKPANFFITKRPDGSPLLKVLDFGISKAPVTMDGGLTSTQAVMGTPSYMSPEQMRSVRDVDARTDIWALGVVLYECLGGRRPFEADTFSALCLQAAMDPTPILQVALPQGLDHIVYRCLEKDPARRYASMAELAAAMAPYAGNQRQASIAVERASAILGLAFAPPTQPHGVPTTRPTYAAPAAPTTLSNSAGSLSTRPSSSRRGMFIGGAVVAVAGVALAIVLATGGGGGASADQDETTPAAAGKPAEPPPAAKAPVIEPTLATPDAGPVIVPHAVDAAPAVVDGPAVDPAKPPDAKTKPDKRKPKGDKKRPPDDPVIKKPPAEDPPVIKKPPPSDDPLNSRT